jgi:hypothetical protein
MVPLLPYYMVSPIPTIWFPSHPTSWFPDTQPVGSQIPDQMVPLLPNYMVPLIPNQLVPRYPTSWFPDTPTDGSKIPNQLVPMLPNHMVPQAAQPVGSQIPNQMVPRHPTSWFSDTNHMVPMIPNHSPTTQLYGFPDANHMAPPAAQPVGSHATRRSCHAAYSASILTPLPSDYSKIDSSSGTRNCVTRARIFKPLKEPRNRFPAWLAPVLYDTLFCCTGPPSYIGWRNRFLGIDSWAP